MVIILLEVHFVDLQVGKTHLSIPYITCTYRAVSFTSFLHLLGLMALALAVIHVCVSAVTSVTRSLNCSFPALLRPVIALKMLSQSSFELMESIDLKPLSLKTALLSCCKLFRTVLFQAILKVSF